MKLRSPKGEGALTLDELDGHTAGLVALVGRSMLSGPRFGVGGLVDRIAGTFGRTQTYVELQRHLLRDEAADNQALVELASAFHVPVIATNGVRFAEPSDRPLYDVLTCIRHKTTLDRAGRKLAWNAERYLKPPEAMARLFADLPEAIAETRVLADRLTYTMADLGYRFPDYPVPAGETMASFLRKITQAGARERYRPYHERARRQIERELDLIDKLDLAGYFLIVWDIVNFCRQQEILVQGRGSAANSAVCYSLGITAVDPVGMDLLFERFLSEQRGEWPDIDLDLPSGDRRERVIQQVYEKYGKSGAAPGGPKAAMTANVITYRGRSAAREVGKTLSIEPEQIDRLAKIMNHFEWTDPLETLDRNLREAGLDFQQPTIQAFGRLWQQIQDLPRHLGQHSGGMVICQGRLDEVVPLENASMPGRVVIQWDKDDCADMGIVKVDLLGLGMMSVLQDALELVNGAQRGAPAAAAEGESSSPEVAASGERGAAECALDLAHLPPDDPAVYRMLQEADTIGIFQVESRAQMATLPRLRPARFYDIVVEVAIIRPGPIVGQMVHPYLKRRQGAEPVVYPHPSLEPILARTLGVPLFQEQLLRMAMVAAGFSGGEAEELRRAFGFKRSEKRMQQIEGKLRDGMARQGITGDAAEEIIRSITSFALYGFPESHAASFALLVYASAYLKAHYPAAFYTAILNNQPMGFYHPATLVKDAQRHGVRFAPIDVQESDWACRVEEDGRVRLGLMYVNGLRAETGKSIALRPEGAAGGERRAAAPASESAWGWGPTRKRLRPEGAAGGERRAAAPASESAWGWGPTRKRLRPEGAAGGERRAAAPASESAWGWGPTRKRLRPEGAAGGERRAAAPASESAWGWGPTRNDECRQNTDGTDIADSALRCPKCGCDDQSMIEATTAGGSFCNICAHEWDFRLKPEATEHARGDSEAASGERRADGAERQARSGTRYASIDDLIARTGLRRDELATLAEIGALNAFGLDRRSALWQIERAVRPSGELFAEQEIETPSAEPPSPERRAPSPDRRFPPEADDDSRTADGRLCRHEPDDRSASDGAQARGAGAARRAAGQRSPARPARPARACRRRGDYAAASRHGEGVRVPHARGRDRHRQHHRAARSLQRTEACDHRRTLPVD